MTPRARLLTALRRAQPDRVPVTMYEYSPLLDDWPHREPSYGPLLALERDFGDSIVWWPSGFGVFFDPATQRRSVETANDGTVTTVTEIDTPCGMLRGVTRRDPGLMTAWTIEPLVKSDVDIERVLALPDPPVPFDAAEWRRVAARVGDRGLMALNPGDALGHVVGLFDFEQFVLRCRKDEGPIRALLARAQAQLVRGMRVFGAVVKDAPVRLWGPEYSGAPLLNPRKYFPRFVVELDRELTRVIHETGNLSVIHCHGLLDALLEMILEIGADALEPLETLPMATADVTLADIKRRIGGRMCLMGGVQAHTLECGTPDEMTAEVRAAVRDGAGGGGFVLLPTSAPFMTPLTPACLTNARAMYTAAHECGRYTNM
jgi:hypothetical protein